MKIDWLVTVTWMALLAIALLLAYAIGNAVVWLVQRVFIMAWPFVQVNGRSIETAILVAAVVGLVAWTMKDRR